MVRTLALAATISAAVYGTSYAAPIAPLPRDQLATNSDVTQVSYHRHHYYNYYPYHHHHHHHWWHHHYWSY
jgi:hypothetical protein